MICKALLHFTTTTKSLTRHEQHALAGQVLGDKVQQLALIAHRPGVELINDDLLELHLKPGAGPISLITPFNIQTATFLCL
jgi:hypothetical protein